jgi:hypothetical protein
MTFGSPCNLVLSSILLVATTVLGLDLVLDFICKTNFLTTRLTIVDRLPLLVLLACVDYTDHIAFVLYEKMLVN